jgi:hypothetical protein
MTQSPLTAVFSGQSCQSWHAHAVSWETTAGVYQGDGLGSLALSARELDHRGGGILDPVPGAGLDPPALTPCLITLARHQLGELLGKVLIGRRPPMHAHGLAEEWIALANPHSPYAVACYEKGRAGASDTGEVLP